MGGLHCTRSPHLAQRSLGRLLWYIRTSCGVVAGDKGGLARAGTGDAVGGSPPLAPRNSQLWFAKRGDREVNGKQTSRPVSLGALRMALQ